MCLELIILCFIPLTTQGIARNPDHTHTQKKSRVYQFLGTIFVQYVNTRTDCIHRYSYTKLLEIKRHFRGNKHGGQRGRSGDSFLAPKKAT